MEIWKNNPLDARLYRVPALRRWKGRNDGEELSQRRWHQHVQLMDLTAPASPEITGRGPAVAVLGFACDEGVKRNLGRPGAAEGPEAIRRALSNLPVFHPNIPIYDAGDITCPNSDLETAQHQLALAVAKVLHNGAFPILLGGGHEIAYAHYCGITAYLKDRQKQGIGIINFDAHFDNREITENGPSSGTGFRQIAEDCGQRGTDFRYLALGIEKTSNTPYLFETARATGTQYALASQFDGNQPIELLENFCQSGEQLYLTIDMDVFAAPYAPGVSAPAYNGIRPDSTFFNCLEKIFASGKLISLDLAELNPAMDIDNRTAKLAASIIFHAVSCLAEQRR